MKTLKGIKRIVVAIIGSTTVMLGVAMIVLPGPAFVLIPAGLAILATEFAWARNLLRRAKDRFRRTSTEQRSTDSSNRSSI
jgi:uncharacterized protein (TIGR02611 family)